MEINRLPIFRINDNNKSQKPDVRFCISCPNLAPLKQDTVSFKGAALKKSDFKGSDFAIIEKYKINPQQLKSKDELQDIAKAKIDEVKEKDFGGRQEETRVQRKAMLKEWFDYVIKENNAYSNAQRLIILSAMTKDLKPNNDTIPHVLNKGVLAQTVTDLEEKLKANPKENFDFNKMYQNNLRTSFMKDSSTGETMTGWVVIPSKINDPENFKKNVEKLKTLSHNNWCTKTFNAEPYLREGDFHVYLENGEPKLGVRFVGNKVQEIQGKRNNGKIPQKYLDTFKEHKKEFNIKLNCNAKYELEKAEIAQKELQKVKQELGSTIELKTIDDAIKIFDYFGIKSEKKDDGFVIDTYCQPEGQFDYEDLGIDENKLFQHITRIIGDANFGNSKITDLGNLHSIDGHAYFNNSQITNLGNLHSIGGDAYFCNSKITNLGNLHSIGGDTSFRSSNIKDLGNLQYIGGNVTFESSKITNLGNLQSIGGYATFDNSEITDLGDLHSIGRDASFSGSKIRELAGLLSIGANVYINNSKLKKNDFENIEIKGEIYT